MSEQRQEGDALIRVLLADDHDILRQGLKLLLGRQPDMQVVGEARTGRQAIALAQELAPDVVVMDITMPDIDGLTASRHIRTHQPATQILMLTMHESEEYFLQALRVGAVGYLVKKAAPTDLQMAIRAVAHGGAFLYPGLAKALIRAYIGSTTSNEPSEAFQSREAAKAVPSRGKGTDIGPQLLTPRELEVLTLVAEGYTSQQIADQLVVSVKTVQAHRANIMEKLGLRDITHLVRFAIRHGLIPSEF
ncbi:MAG TPA: response regulator transcription factor [Ktedonobacteraceae bacterium]|nr:response regulator transcription factor [Ktedonobacteraceae bacterium]